MTPPIFVFCSNDDLLMFSSPEAACAYTEPIDVEEGEEYRAAYDAIGRRLVLEVPEPRRQKFLWIFEISDLKRVTIRMLSDEAEASDELRQILLRTLGVADAQMPLADLVERAKQELSFS